ncbi:AAA family ATPase [Aestuariibius insulae]|uniref:AAA family ATPase n=1 Tax=Aestuariibius insulae TaxID=2058287 RepID=UPI00345EFA48
MDLLTTTLTAAVQSDFFAGGLALGAFGLLAASLRLGGQMLHRMISRRIWTSLTLDNRSTAYRHFYIWMEHNDVLAGSRHVRMTDDRWAIGTKGYAPAPGSHWFIHQGRICRLDRDLSEKAKVGAPYEQRPMETLHLTILFGQIGTLLRWIDEGRRIACTKDRIGPGLHILKGDYWDSLGDVPRRRIDTVLVDDDRIERVLEDMRWFYAARDWYAKRGVPWRRGYLFHGPPGTGKSSLIRALASELSRDIAALDLGRPSLGDDDLRDAMAYAPTGSLIAIEDVDAVFTRRDSAEKPTGVSFSGLLNAIDGVAAQEGRALIMTTNHKERLDPALIRPGRADLHMELGLISAATATRLFERFFPEDRALARQFRTRLDGHRISPAAVQGWLLASSADPVRAAGASGLIPAGPRIPPPDRPCRAAASPYRLPIPLSKP